MATLPQYDPQATPRPIGTPYDETRVTPDAFGAPAAENLQQAAGLLHQVAHQVEQERQRASTARVMQTVGDFGIQADSLLHDPKAGILNLQGEAALGAYDGTVKTLRELQQKTAAGLADDHQRELFLAHSTDVLRTAIRQVELHTGQQGQQLQQFGLQSTQKSMLDSSVKAIDQVSADSYTTLGANATRAFWSDRANSQIADEKTREFVAASNAARLDRLLANPDTAGDAIRFFQSRHDALPAAQLDTYTAKVAAVGEAGKAQATALGIVGSSMSPNGQVDQRKAQGLIDALKVPETTRHLVQQLVDHRSVIYDKAWRDEATDMAAKVVDQARDPVTGELSLATVNPADFAALEQKWPQKANEIRKGVAIEGAKERYASAVESFFGPDGWQETARMTPQAFTTDSRLLSLPAKHRTALVERYQAMQKRVNREPDETIVLDEARKALGLGKKGKIGALSDEKKQAFADLFDSVHKDARDFAISNSGQQADREKIREYTRQELLVVDSGFFRPTVRQFQRVKKAALPPQSQEQPIEDLLPLPPPGQGDQ